MMINKPFVVFFIALMSFLPGLAQSPGGYVSDHNFFSQALGKEMTCRVYLPGTYQSDNPDLTFPVIYSLHGASVGYEAYDLIYPIIDALWISGTVKPFILVMPDGKAEPYNGSFYSNSALYGNYEDYLINDLIPFIDSAFNTQNTKPHRAIMGHSMGSYGALKLAFKHPELFVGVAGHSGPLNIEQLDLLVPDLKEENGGSSPYSWEPAPGKGLTNLAVTMAGAWSPNLEAPFQIDFPLDSVGEIIPEIMDRWKPHNVSRIARTLSPDAELSIYFDCGSMDEYLLHYQNRSLSDTLTKYNIPHRYEEYFGDHNTGLIFRVPEAIIFLADLISSTSNSPDYTMVQHTIRIYPNPANHYVIIDGIAPEQLGSEYKIMDLTGKSVITGQISALAQKINVSILKPGIYFMKVSNTTTTGRIVIR